MSLVLDELPRNPDRLLPMLQRTIALLLPGWCGATPRAARELLAVYVGGEEAG